MFFSKPVALPVSSISSTSDIHNTVDLCWSPCARYVVSLSLSGVVTMYDVNTRDIVNTFQGVNGPSKSISVSSEYLSVQSDELSSANIFKFSQILDKSNISLKLDILG
ncbi:hypothetical protein GEMRC1_002309 [Eukaryota sp. GEM-RC1]